jgi:hypothetical protein
MLLHAFSAGQRPAVMKMTPFRRGMIKKEIRILKYEKYNAGNE